MTKDSKLKKLKRLKRDYASERKGYRERQYDTLGDTMAIVVELRTDPHALKGFLKLSGMASPQRSVETPKKWLTSAAVAYVTAAKSESAIKLACKRARVLDHLHDYHGVSVEDIAAEIRARGGIEKLANLAAKENPRRPKAESRRNAATTSKSKRGPSGMQRRDVEGPYDDLDDELGSNSDWPPRKDDAGDENDMLLIRAGLDVRTELKAIKARRRVKLIGIRTENDDGDGVVFVAKKVILLK